MPATAGERRESQEDQEGRTRVQGTLLKSKKPGFDAAEMVFDQGNKMVKMNCKKDH